MPTGVVGEMAKLPVLSRLSVKVMPMLAVGESESVSVAMGAASIVTVQVSDMPSGAL